MEVFLTHRRQIYLPYFLLAQPWCEAPQALSTAPAAMSLHLPSLPSLSKRPSGPPPANATDESPAEPAKAPTNPGFVGVMSGAIKQNKLEDEEAELAEMMRKERAERRQSKQLKLDLHELEKHEGHTHAVFCVSFDSSGRLLLTASADKTVKLWDLQSRKVLNTFYEHEQWVYSCCFFNHSMAFATGCDDGRVRIWENQTKPINHETGWKMTCDLGGKDDSANGHRAGVHSVSCSIDDSYIVSGGADTYIKLWRRLERECFLTLRGHTDWVTRAVFDKDILLMVSSSYDTHVKLWRLSDGEELLTFYGHKSFVSDVVWGPEGRTIATSSGDYTVRLWQVKRPDGTLSDGLPLLILYGHTNWVTSVNFSQNGLRLCSSCCDSTAIVWNVATGDLEHRLKHKNWVEHASFAPTASGEQLATCGHDVDVYLWNLHTGTAQIASVLQAKASYLLMFYYWLRSRVYGKEYLAPPLSHMRRAALRALFDALDRNEENSVPIPELIQGMMGNALLKPLMQNTEHRASMMHGEPRTAYQALTAWSLSSDDIGWRELLSVFEDPAAEGQTRSMEDDDMDSRRALSLRGSLKKLHGLGSSANLARTPSDFTANRLKPSGGFSLRPMTKRATSNADETIAESTLGEETPRDSAWSPSPSRASSMARGDSLPRAAAPSEPLKLDLSEQELTAFPEVPPNATHIDASDNELTEVPAAIGDATGLEELLLFKNKIKTVDKAVGTLGKLTTLNLFNNAVMKVPADIGQLGALEELNLAANKIPMLSDAHFAGLTSLRILTLNDNRLVRLGSLAKLRNLEELRLFNNNLEEMPTIASSMPALKIVEVNKNRIAAIPAAFFSSVPALERLCANANMITAIPATVSECPRLTILQLQENQLESLPDADWHLLEMLETLFVQQNRDLAELPPKLGRVTTLRRANLGKAGPEALVEQIKASVLAKGPTAMFWGSDGQAITGLAHEDHEVIDHGRD